MNTVLYLQFYVAVFKIYDTQCTNFCARGAARGALVCTCRGQPRFAPRPPQIQSVTYTNYIFFESFTFFYFNTESYL